MDDSAITFDEVIESYDEEIKTFPTNFNEKKVICKMQNFYILLAFLLIAIALSIAVSIYCYLIKYWEIQKYSRITNYDRFYINKFIIKMVSNDKLKEIELSNRTYYYFHDIIKIEDFDLDNILIDEKLYKKFNRL